MSKLNNLKGKISNKVSNITKEHKFFTENAVCPTCRQDIEEDFRLNRIDAQDTAKELKKGFDELESTIKFEQERERQFNSLTKEITNLTHGISQNNTRINLDQVKSEILNMKFKLLPATCRTEILNMRN